MRQLDDGSDDLDRPTRMTVTGDGASPTTATTYWPSGERDRFTNSHDTVERRFYDDQGLLAVRTTQRDGESVPQPSDTDRYRVYEYDEDANPQPGRARHLH